MKSLSRISTIFIVFTFVFALENNSTISGENTDVNNTDSNMQAIDSEVLPIDIDAIRESRLAKAKVEKIKSQHILNSHKNGVEDQNQISNPNIELIGKEIKAKQMLKERKDVNIFEEFSRKIKKKYIMRSIGDNSSGSKIKFPVETESK